MILSVEPLESLRYIDYLGPDGIIVTSSNPYMNIGNYPDLDKVLDRIRAVKNSVIIDSDKLAREAGSIKAQNMVVLGAASRHLILKKETLEEFIRVLFMSRSESLADMNVRAFRLGYNASS